MMQTGQFVFTASPWGRSPAGWMVFASSPGLDASVVSSLVDLYGYCEPADGSHPAQFVVVDIDGSDTVLLCRTTFLGERWYDPRPGDWLAHGFILPGEAYRAAAAAVSPMAWFRSPSFISEYLDEWKEKATAVLSGRIPYEDPPDLPPFVSMDGIDRDPAYSFESLLYSMPESSLPKLLPIVRAVLARASGSSDGCGAVAFDARHPASIRTMSLCLELLPPQIRARARFTTYIGAESAKTSAADLRFAFYGTVLDGEVPDPDTGLYPRGGDAYADGRGAEPLFATYGSVAMWRRLVSTSREGYRDLLGPLVDACCAEAREAALKASAEAALASSRCARMFLWRLAAWCLAFLCTGIACGVAAYALIEGGL